MATMDNHEALLPGIIDARAAAEPDRLYGAYATSLAGPQDVVQVTYARMANGINRLAWFLAEKFGTSTSYETVAYMGPSDIRYILMVMAAVKIGYKAQLLSLSNPPAAQVQLLESVACSRLVVASNFEPIQPAVDAILVQRPMKKVELPPVEHWMQLTPVAVYPFHAKLSDDPRRPFVVLHTSGSTGTPKPITYRFDAIIAYRNYVGSQKVVPSAPQTYMDVWKDHTMYLPFPLFHMVGALSATVSVVYWNMPFILGPPHIPLSPEVVIKMIQLPLCQSAVISPSVLHGIAQNTESLDALRKLSYLIWCGAPLTSLEVAEKLRARVLIYAAYGATETGPLPLTVEDQSEHEWMRFHPMIGASFRHFEDDLYELVIQKKPDIDNTQFVFRNWPDLHEWPTKDLMSKHPTEDMWRYRGRRDDCIVLSMGRNIVTLEQEAIVMSHPAVTGALLTGMGRPSTAWLIETTNPPSNHEEKRAMLESVWPVVERANAAGTVEAIADQRAIVFTQPDKPMSRAPKGSIQRQTTLQSYETELAAVYDVSTANEVSTV